MKLITIQELSELLKVKPKTLYQWAELGNIPCTKLNGCLRFNLDDIEAWVKDSTNEPSSGYNPLTQARGPRKGVDR